MRFRFSVKQPSLFFSHFTVFFLKYCSWKWKQKGRLQTINLDHDFLHLYWVVCWHYQLSTDVNGAHTKKKVKFFDRVRRPHSERSWPNIEHDFVFFIWAAAATESDGGTFNVYKWFIIHSALEFVILNIHWQWFSLITTSLLLLLRKKGAVVSFTHSFWPFFPHESMCFYMWHRNFSENYRQFSMNFG